MAKRKVNKSNNTVVLSSILVILIILILVFFNRNSNKSQVNLTTSKKCSNNGFLPIEDYLPVYVVKKGDTLLSISKNLLNSTSRINEIIKLNESKYPQLSLTNPFIEIGWELVLPPKELTASNGLIYVVGGEVSVSDKGWGINWTNAGVGPFSLSSLPDNIKMGSCVIAIYQGNQLDNPSELKIISVTRQ